MFKSVLAGIAASVLLITVAAAAPAREDRRIAAIRSADEIIALRSSLAKTFIMPNTAVTEETFKNVCGAVAKRVKEISKKEGVIIRHAAVRYRNPLNAATPQEAYLINKFDINRNSRDFWDTAVIDDKGYLLYARPIFVEEACLSCHGPGEARPRFIAEKYPDDRAFGFKTGDLRGIILILIPSGE